MLYMALHATQKSQEKRLKDDKGLYSQLEHGGGRESTL